MFFLLLILSSPFYIDYPPCKNPTQEDYVKIDAMKQSLKIPADDLSNEIASRMQIGVYFPLAYPEKLPQKNLIKINQGGDCVVVSYADYGDRRPKKLLDRMQMELEKSGFNGYLYTLIGGYPTPRGNELCFAATPYAFKMFIMEEAYLLGFHSVLWLDARLFPLKDITPLFEMIKEHGALLNLTETLVSSRVSNEARECLLDFTQTDVLKNKAISTPVFGLDMHRPEVRAVLEDFYEACVLGIPFFSCYPEETVLSALIAKHCKHIPFVSEHSPKIYPRLFIYSHSKYTDQKLAVYAKKLEFYFFGISNEGICDLEQIILHNALKRN